MKPSWLNIGNKWHVNLSRATCIAVYCKSDSAILSGDAFSLTFAAHMFDDLALSIVSWCRVLIEKLLGKLLPTYSIYLKNPCRCESCCWMLFAFLAVYVVVGVVVAFTIETHLFNSNQLIVRNGGFTWKKRVKIISWHFEFFGNFFQFITILWNCTFLQISEGGLKPVAR